MALLKSPYVAKKARHIDLRTKVLYESRANKIIEDFHLPATDQGSDIGTKQLNHMFSRTFLSVFKEFCQSLNSKVTLRLLLNYIYHLNFLCLSLGG